MVVFIQKVLFNFKALLFTLMPPTLPRYFLIKTSLSIYFVLLGCSWTIPFLSKYEVIDWTNQEAVWSSHTWTRLGRQPTRNTFLWGAPKRLQHYFLRELIRHSWVWRNTHMTTTTCTHTQNAKHGRQYYTTHTAYAASEMWPRNTMWNVNGKFIVPSFYIEIPDTGL